MDGMVRAFAHFHARFPDRQLAVICKLSPQRIAHFQLMAASLGIRPGALVFTGYVSDEDLVARVRDRQRSCHRQERTCRVASRAGRVVARDVHVDGVRRTDDLVDAEAGADARVFFLKVDVEGAEALVLAGARRLFERARVAYVLFESHSKWTNAQADLGVVPFIGVGDVVAELTSLGYTCFYSHHRGLIPFASRGTPAGERARPVSECHEGLPFCAWWRVYSRQFWSNVLCAAPTEQDTLGWLLDAYVAPGTTRESLLATLPKRK
jgi:FkbM family methyltransferase